MFLLRFFVFHLYESPKYLMGRGREEEAVRVLGEVARWNGRGGWWEEVKGAERVRGGLRGAEEVVGARSSSRSFKERDVVDVVDVDTEKGRGGVRTGAIDGVRRQLDKFSTEHVRALFATRKLAWSTSLLITLWALIGLAFPLCVQSIVSSHSSRSSCFSSCHYHCGNAFTYACRVVGITPSSHISASPPLLPSPYMHLDLKII